MEQGFPMRNNLICWDSCVLIELIKGDNEARIHNILPIAESISKKQYGLIVSALVYVEVLESKMPSTDIKRFEGFMQNRKEVEIVAVDTQIARKARAIRDSGIENGKKISTPDAVHLATAIISGARYLHTFDHLLLSLNGEKEAEGIDITPCYASGITRSLFGN